MPIHGDLNKFNEVQGAEQQFTLQNSKLLKVDLRHGEVLARAGAMVAYQGDAKFQNKGSGGVGKFLKKAATGEGATMMHVTGSGEVFLANQAEDILVLYLENDQISVNGKNLLAHSASVASDIKSVGGGLAGAMAGGLFNMALTGTGYVAITTDGPPVMLDVTSAPTFADPQAAVMWTAGVSMSINRDTTGGAVSVMRGSGETIQMAFGGEGFVLVQPSEGRFGGAGGGGDAGGGGLLGQVLGG